MSTFDPVTYKETTERQWQDVFAAAGYTPAVANRYIRRIRQKIEDGQRLTPEATR